eukprot:TRINITY_DN1234_c3_g2_i1.p1 TRINITY_DN1234_c3_g2~~TRINITY_DN1234_c3_g2_i1.p1  ORF type:complete len:419 (+),score=44.93 TRINITY_DN1234_c3_g2_i1:323-1579(+)
MAIRFFVCSITKVFTDIMLYKMRDAGLVNTHDPVQKFIPSYSVINPYNVTGVNTTLHQLANQNSGLAREVPCPYEDQSKCSGEYILDQVRKQYLVYPPNTHPHYSNLGFSLLGRTLQVAAGQKYEDYVLDEITTPLGMLSTGFNYTESVMDRLAIGSLLSKNNSLIPAQITPLGWGTPAGGLYSTANDMAKFISGFFFNQSNPDAILSATSVNEMTGYSFNLQDGVSAFGSPFEMYYNNSLWYVMKAGGYTGYRAELLLVPSLKLGIFTAGSSEYQGGDDSLFTLEIAKTILPVLTQIISESQPSAHLPPSWKSYVGSYTWFSDAYYDTITNLTVAVNEDMTTLNATAVYSNGGNAFQGTLTYFLGDTFRITFPVDGTDCRFFDDGLEGEFFTFSPPLNGGLSDSVFLMGNTYNRTSA